MHSMEDWYMLISMPATQQMLSQLLALHTKRHLEDSMHYGGLIKQYRPISRLTTPEGLRIDIQSTAQTKRDGILLNFSVFLLPATISIPVHRKLLSPLRMMNRLTQRRLRK